MITNTEVNKVKPKEVQQGKATRDHLKEWLKRHKNAQAALPYVQQNLDRIEWELEALNNRPDEAAEIPLADIETKLVRDHDHLTKALPMMPDYDLSTIVGSTTIATSGSSGVYEYVTKVGDLGTPDTLAYFERYTLTYDELQDAQERPQAVRALIEKLDNSSTLERFDKASNAYFAAKSGTGERTATASEMRTLLDGVQGDLFKKARRWPKENMPWDKMTERLTKGEPGGVEQKELVNQGKTRSKILSRLSDILKDREGSSSTNLNNLWTQLIDHLYVVLGLINFGDD